ncbi:Transketolase [Sorochytrium milnesiophthora]
MSSTFAAIDQRAVNTIRTLAADTVQKSNSGHPGAPMGCAPMAHVLFTRAMKLNPANPKWPGRDRYVQSNGHSCVLQYTMLHLLGYDMSIDDLKNFRQIDSKTPGHPESHLTAGIEVSTGPLGQGIANAVGLALAEAHMAAQFNRPNFNIIDNYTFVILGDGCMQEGVASEACSLAGHWGLGKLIALYDDNHIQIDGDTALGFSEDVIERFHAYGWHTQVLADGDHDFDGILNAIEAAKKVTDKPSLIKIRTTIGFGSAKAGTEKVHGAALGDADVAHVKKELGFDEKQFFHVPPEVQEFYGSIKKRGGKLEQEWNDLFAKYKQAHPDLAAEFERRREGKLPANIDQLLPRYKTSDSAAATRKLSENVLNAIAPHLPELIGGSADLTGSNLTRWKGAEDFQHERTKIGTYKGRYVRFGVREHGMAAICNGMSGYGFLIPFGATFLNFISYAVGATRLSALSEHQVIYIMTHDSIGLGEDGPTHQPIETLACLRATPNMLVLRPSDGNEVSGAYLAALHNKHRPSVIALSRQNVPHLPNTSPESVLKGANIIHDAPSGKPDVIFVATGTETSIAYKAVQELASENIQARLVSMPSWELFEEQDMSFRTNIFPRHVPVVSVEALSVFGWDKYAHGHVGMRTFGASGPYEKVYEKFGITVDGCKKMAKQLLEYYKGKEVPYLLEKPF